MHYVCDGVCVLLALEYFQHYRYGVAKFILAENELVPKVCINKRLFVIWNRLKFRKTILTHNFMKHLFIYMKFFHGLDFLHVYFSSSE